MSGAPRNPLPLVGRARAVRVNGVTIPVRELRLRFVRASGPGGQNVNKVASKVVLRFDLRGSPSISETARRRALERLAHRLTHDGELILTSGTHRDQSRNRDAVIRRFCAILAQAMTPPRRRIATRPSRVAEEHRLAAKRARSELKRERRRTED